MENKTQSEMQNLIKPIQNINEIDNTSSEIDDIDNSIKSMQDIFYKQRKLTSDSGFGDEDERFDVYSTSPNIGEDKFSDNLHDIIETCKDVKIEDISTSSSNDIDLYDNDLNGHSDVPSKRKRRMTPIPNQIESGKLSKEPSSKCQILFVEEEDEDDIEKYYDEEDFICSDISTKKQISSKRNSWDGISGLDPIEAYKIRLLTLKKSKSLDRGKDQHRRRRRMNYQRSYTTDCVLSEEKMPYLDINKNDGPLAVKNQTTCYSFKTLNKDWSKENSSCPIQIMQDSETNDDKKLPIWMRDAESELFSDDSDDSTSELNTSQSTKLQIPNIDWEKLNESKNKTNELLSNQRKQIMKQKKREQRMDLNSRRRKLTPSESPSHASLEKLSALRNTASVWILEEEEENEEEEEKS